MRPLFIALTCLVAFVLAPAPAADSKADFLAKDLSNWEGLLDHWSQKDGALVGTTYPKGAGFNTFLCSKAKYKDFELTFKVRIKDEDGNGNSGVQIRSRIRDAEEDKRHFAVEGPQCDMGQQFWGSLYGEHFGGMMKAAPKDVVSRVKKGEFNDYAIKCVGKHVTIKLNGETTVDQDFDQLPDEGIIAWQLHQGGPMEVTFKDIQFKNLSEKK
jgi:hypothetical protein